MTKLDVLHNKLLASKKTWSLRAKSANDVADTKAYYSKLLSKNHVPMSFEALKKKISELGYVLKFSFNYLNEYNPPDRWLASNYMIDDKETGLSFAHDQGRTDSRYDELQRLRGNVAVLKNSRIIEF